MVYVMDIHGIFMIWDDSDHGDELLQMGVSISHGGYPRMDGLSLKILWKLLI